MRREKSISPNDLEEEKEKETIRLAETSGLHKKAHGELRTSEEFLGQVLDLLTHNFNNILMPILINSEIVLHELPEGSPIKEYLKIMQEAAHRGKDLIEEIIALSRKEENRTFSGVSSKK